MLGTVVGAALALILHLPGPPYPTRQLYRQIALLLTAMGGSAACAGGAGFLLSRYGGVTIPGEWDKTISPQMHRRFMAVWFAHTASYLAGFIGSGVLIYRVWTARGKPLGLTIFPQDKMSVVRAMFFLAVLALIVWQRLIKHS